MIDFVIISVLILLASTKVVLQSKFSKRVGGVFGNIAFNGAMFAAGAVFFTPFLIKNGADMPTLAAGVIMGVLSVAFQLCYLFAFSCGNTSLTVIIGNFSMLMPIAVSVAYCGESFGATKILGTAMAILSCCLTGAKGKSESGGNAQSRGKWLFFTFAAFLCNGAIAVNQKLYAVNTPSPKSFEFVAISYIAATVLSALVYGVLLLAKKGTEASREITFSPRDLLPGLIIGVILGVFQSLYTYANSVIDGTLLFPTYNCGVSIVTLLAGRIIFGEKLSVKGKVGAAVGIVATAFLCL